MNVFCDDQSLKSWPVKTEAHLMYDHPELLNYYMKFNYVKFF